MSDAKTGQDAIWAPWRLPYLESIGDAEGMVESARAGAVPGGRAGGAGGRGDAPGSENPSAPDLRPPVFSFLSDYWKAPERDAANLVVERDASGMILLNRYPYANGHLLVALGEPRPRLLDYTPEQRAALWRLIERGMELMERALEPQGVNVGINQGRAAGAGVPHHLHAHLVPRWGGDVNFMTVVGGVRVIPSALEAMWERYRRAAERF